MAELWWLRWYPPSWLFANGDAGNDGQITAALVQNYNDVLTSQPARKTSIPTGLTTRVFARSFGRTFERIKDFQEDRYVLNVYIALGAICRPERKGKEGTKARD
ncbi:hypothetical protein [Streptomyces luteolifulvus]|uniref:hypothetical protein n=1 Tax=Streptomyces luteolifulvus TaxID=2615112 RepID=UPI001780325F|nr:hypothetical protein [Streptomyces luteolifulvus]